MTITTINPYNGESLKTYELMSSEQLTHMVNQSAAAYRSWRQEPFETRAKAISQLGDALIDHQSSLAEIMTLEMGKTLDQARAEVKKSAWLCAHFAKQGAQYLEHRAISLDDANSATVVYQPTGTILGIMPWNYPIWQVIRFIVPTMLAGNTVLMRHASNVTGSAIKLSEVITKILPENIFQLIICEHDQVEEILSQSSVTGVSLTGSSAAGKKVAATAGRYLKKCVLELGGADPYLVLPDADITLAARQCVAGRMKNNGQSCIAAKRFIVHRSIEQQFTEAVCAEMSSYNMGNPLADGTKLGPVARQDLRDELHTHVENLTSSGAKLLMGGTIDHSKPGFFYPPTVISQISDTELVGRTEMFGPVATIIGAESIEKMVSIANQSIYGLGGAVFSQDLKQASKVALQIETGSVAINDLVNSDPRVPFGGIKESGIGREMSAEGIREFCNVKSIIGPAIFS